MKNRNRILAMLLSVMMVLTYMPAIAFAEGEEPADPDTPASEQVEEPAEEQPAETETANPAPAANPADSESTFTDEDEPESEEPQNEEKTNTQEPLKPAKSPKAETTPTADIADSNELLWDYLNKEVSSELGRDTGAKKPGLLRALNRTRGDQLKGVEQTIYFNLKSQIEAFADPNNEETPKSSAFYVPLTSLVGSYFEAEEIQVEGSEDPISAYGVSASDFERIISGYEFAFDSNNIISALLSDLPYAMYWYDKTTEAYTILDDYYPDDDYVYFAKDAGVWFYLYVSADFSVDGKTGTTDFDTTKVERVKTAVNNATDIIDNASGSNLEILKSYKDAICSMTDYDNAAGSKLYGDPWQLISVFDNDPDTKVVCEGYSKAFQFLCDKTYALEDAGIECDSVSGTMTVGTGEGPHMWNILHMDDNRNYIADITNCDEGDAADDKLFLKGANAGGSVADGYSYACGVGYTYDEDTRSQFSDKELVMSEKDYSETEEVVWDDETGLAYALVNSDGEEIAKVVGYKGTATTITIPEELGGRPVRSFAINPNKPVEGDTTDYSTIKSLVLPENMIYIRGKCIRRFEGLESITIIENAFFKTADGVLYSKEYDYNEEYEGVEVVCYPPASTNTKWTMDPDTLYFYPRNQIAVEELTLSEKISYVFTEDMNQCFRNLKAVNAPAGCQKFSSINGVLFNKDKTELIWYPTAASAKEYTVPSGVTYIHDDAFAGNSYLESVVLSPEINYVCDYAFVDYDFKADNLKTITFTSNSVPNDPLSFQGVKSAVIELGTKIVYPENVEGFSAFVAALSIQGFEELPDDVEVLECDNEVEFTSDSADKVYSFSFTPEDDGDYYINITRYEPYDEGSSLRAVVFRKGVSFEQQRSTNEASIAYDISDYKDETHYLQIIPGSACRFSIAVGKYDGAYGFEDIPDTCETITVGEEKSVDVLKAGETVTYEFIPEVDGDYVFESLGDADSVGRIADSDGKELDSDDDNGSELNFSITFHAEAGKTYYLQAKAYSDNFGAFTVTLKDKIENHEHNLEHFPAIEATDEKDGNIEYWHCTICDNYYSDANAKNRIAKSATVTTSGLDISKDAEVSCEQVPYTGQAANPAVTVTYNGSELTSGEDYTITLPDECIKPGHYLLRIVFKGEYKGTATCEFDIVCEHEEDEGTVTKEATCKTMGEKTYCCKKCGESMRTEKIHADSNAHVWDEGKITKEATATEDGVKTYTCTLCGTTKTEVIPKSGAHTHTPAAAVKENEVKATCSKAGSYDEVVYCKDCKAEISRTKKTTDKIAHTPAAAVKENEVKATSSSTGSYEEVVYCSVCKAEISRTKKTTDKLPPSEGEKAVAEANAQNSTASSDANSAAAAADKIAGEGSGAVADAAIAAAQVAADKAEAAADQAISKAETAVAKATTDAEKAAAQKALTAAKSVKAAASKASASVSKTAAKAAAVKATTTKTAAAAAETKAAGSKKTADDAAAKAADAKKAVDAAKAGTDAAVTAAKAYETATADAAAKAKAAADDAQAAADKEKAASDAAKAAADAADKAVAAAEKAEAAAKAAYGENSDQYKAAQSATKAAKDTAAKAKTDAASAKTASDKAAANAKAKKDAATAAATTATKAASAAKAAAEAKEKADHTGTPEVTLSSTELTYAYKVQKIKVKKKKKAVAVGTIQKPSVTSVRLNGNALRAGTDYDVAYSNEESANIGTYTVTVTLKGDYSGKGTATYTINPKAVNLKKAAKGKKSFTASWKKLSKNDIKYKVIGGYQLRYSTDPAFPDGSTKVIKAGTLKSAKKAVKKLQAKTTYYVQLRTYKAVSGVTYYSVWSPAKTVVTK